MAIPQLSLLLEEEKITKPTEYPAAVINPDDLGEKEMSRRFGPPGSKGRERYDRFRGVD